MQTERTGGSIKAMVVDDAAFMRKALVEILSGAEGIEVIGVAKHGKEALEAIQTLRPDVITLDVDMPIMDGLTTMKHIMVRDPMPVVMVSGLANQGRITFEALSLGAVDFFPKPSGTVSDDIHDSRAELVRTLRVAAGINPRAIKRAAKGPGRPEHHQAENRQMPGGLLIVVALQGAVSSFIRLASAIFPLRDVACLCIQDMSSSVQSAYARELDVITGCAMAYESDQPLYEGCCSLLQKQDLPQIETDSKNGMFLVRPDDPCNLDEFFRRASGVFGEDLSVCILGGQAPKGAHCLEAVRERGGSISALVPEKCASGEFARAAIEQNLARPFSSEQSLWSSIEAFSRQMILKKRNRA